MENGHKMLLCRCLETLLVCRSSVY